MTTTNPSRLNLENLLSLIKAAELEPARRRDMASAVNMVAKVLNSQPRDIEANPRMLGIRLKTVSPIALGMSPGRWHNIRSLLRKALELAQPIMAGQTTTPLLPGWVVLMGHLADMRSRRIRLSRLVRWLSEQGIGPDSVTWDDINRFRHMMMNDALLGEPEKTWTDTRRTWNLAVSKVPGWPQVPYPEASRKDVYVMPWSAFPASLKQDVDKWLDRLAGKDFADDGPARAVSASTLTARNYQLRSFASALVLQGVAVDTLTSLAACLTKEHFKTGLRFYRDRNEAKSSSWIHGLASMLKSVAKHWCKFDDIRLTEMAKVVKKLAVEQTGLTQKNRDRLRPMDDPAVLQRLYNLPSLLQKVADDEKVPTGRRRASAQTAVALEILLFAPIRAKNLLALELDRHILKVGDTYHVVIPAEEVKNNTDLEFVLQGRSVALLQWYLQNHRQAPAGEKALFPGKKAAKSKGATSYHINAVVQKYVGIEVNMHLFRHIAAKTYLDANPGEYETVRRVLGHKKMETTTNFYTGLETRRATEQFGRVVEAQRSGAGQGGAR